MANPVKVISTAYPAADVEPPGTATLYRWALSFIRPYAALVLLLIGCDLTVSFLQMTIPKFIQFLIDKVLPQKNSHLLLPLLTVLTIVFVLSYLFSAARNLLSRHVSEKPSRDVQSKVIHHLYDLGFAYYEHHPVGETLSLLHTDVAALQGIYRDFPKLIQDMLLVCSMMIILFHTHGKLSMSVLPCFAMFYLAEPYLSGKADLWGKRRADSLRSRNRKMYDSLVSMAEVRAYGAEGWSLENLAIVVDTYQSHDLQSAKYRLIRAVIRNVTITFGAVVLYVYGSFLVRANEISIGELVSFSIIYFMAIGRFTFLFFRLSAFRALQHQIKSLYLFFLQKPEVMESTESVTLATIQGELSFSGVRFRYPGRLDVLTGIDLTVHAGERVALVGTSGSGKSTVLRLITRFYDPTEGDICLDGVPVSRLTFSQLREAVGHVFQETFLFATSIKENIRFGKPAATDEEVMEAAKAAFAHEFIVRFPNGYETNVGERGVKLSGGQKQRIAIARMLIKDPAIVILDEATSSLDQTSEAEVTKSLAAALSGRTILAAAHRLSTVRQFDRIVVIDEGKIVESGSYDELMERNGIFYRLVQKQLIEGEEQDA